MHVLNHFSFPKKQLLLACKKNLMIKKLLFAGVILLTACSGSPEKAARESGKEIFFKEMVHNYGDIQQDSDGTYEFIFKNISDKSLVVNRARSTCGCTVPLWSKEPIAPGEKGKIVVKYNTSVPGSFTKSVYVYSTAANSPVKLQIKGKVIPRE